MINRFLNKNTGEEKFIDIPENATKYRKEEIFAYNYLNYADFVQIPDTGDFIRCDKEPFYKESIKPKSLEELKTEKLTELQKPIIIGEFSIPFEWAQDSVNAHYLLNTNIVPEITVPGTTLTFNKVLINQLMPIYSKAVIEKRQKIASINAAQTIEEIKGI